ITELVQNYRYETAYACEGKTLKIGCQEGEVIKLIRANYGRFSITICNDHGNTDWSVNCMSQKSLRVLHARCSQYQNCSILASTSLFGDPCPGTLKYLEAHYQCLPGYSTTSLVVYSFNFRNLSFFGNRCFISKYLNQSFLFIFIFGDIAI
ncbi:hypothetical protein AMK59_2411, partial [Oryctes borbonicus]